MGMGVLFLALELEALVGYVVRADREFYCPILRSPPAPPMDDFIMMLP